jgi:hypothetical protein
MYKLMTAVELEAELGAKYFYRQRTYRFQKAGKIRAFALRGQQCFLPNKVVEAYINELKARIYSTVPELKNANVFYDNSAEPKRMVADGIFGRYVAVETDKENEEDLIKKLLGIKEWIMSEPEAVVEVLDEPVNVEGAIEQAIGPTRSPKVPAGVFPSEIRLVEVKTDVVAGVEVKSYFLFSLPSIADFIGVRSDAFSKWVQGTSFKKFVVSIHNRKLDGPQISGPFVKGFEKGFTPLLPFELVPELLVAFKQSGRTPDYPARAEQLYNLASSTLEAVGLAISGNSDKAASELAKVSEGLGISTAEQVVALFKRYESRNFQVNENKRFHSKIKAVGDRYDIVTSDITVGVTGMTPNAWKDYGKDQKLPYKHRVSSREVMRHTKPEESVGITFSESHYIKNHSDMEEVIETGLQGKLFYKRLKDVGLLDD